MGQALTAALFGKQDVALGTQLRQLQFGGSHPVPYFSDAALKDSVVQSGEVFRHAPERTRWSRFVRRAPVAKSCVEREVVDDFEPASGEEREAEGRRGNCGASQDRANRLRHTAYCPG